MRDLLNKRIEYLTQEKNKIDKKIKTNKQDIIDELGLEIEIDDLNKLISENEYLLKNLPSGNICKYYDKCSFVKNNKTSDSE